MGDKEKEEEEEGERQRCLNIKKYTSDCLEVYFHFRSQSNTQMRQGGVKVWTGHREIPRDSIRRDLECTKDGLSQR